MSLNIYLKVECPFLEGPIFTGSGKCLDCRYYSAVDASFIYCDHPSGERFQDFDADSFVLPRLKSYKPKPKVSGAFILCDQKRQIVYIGYSENCEQRVEQLRDRFDWQKYCFVNIGKFDTNLLIHRFQPKNNQKFIPGTFISRPTAKNKFGMNGRDFGRAWKSVKIELHGKKYIYLYQAEFYAEGSFEYVY